MKQIYKKTADVIKDNYVYFTVIAVSYFVLLLCNIVYKIIPYGDNFPISGIGFTQVYGEYVNAIENVKTNGVVGILDFSQGIVSDNYGVRSHTFLYMLLRPWLYIIFLILPEELYPVFYPIVNYFYFVAAGAIFVFYLLHRKDNHGIEKNNPRLILVGLAYSLCSYNSAYYIYGGFRYLVFIPLVFLGIEKLVYERKAFLYTISLFVFMTCDAYTAFIFCIFIVLYFFLLDYEDYKELFKCGIRVAIFSIIAAGLAAFVLIPFYYRTLNSPYESGDSSWPSLSSWFGNLLFPLSDFSPLTGGVITSPEEYRANIYCGLPVLILLPLYAFIKNVSKSKKIKTIVFALLLYLAFDNQFINFVFHGFHHQWQVPNRFASFFIFIVLTMFFDVLLEMDSFSKKQVMLSVTSSSILLALSYVISGVNSVSTDVTIKGFIPAFIFLLIYLVVACIYCFKKENLVYYKIFFIIMVIELTVSSFWSLHFSMGTEDYTDDIKYAEKIRNFSEVIADINQPFVITERPGSNDNPNMALMAKTNSLSYYTSSSFKQDEELLHRWGVLFGTNLTYYTTGSALADMMLHVKYHITDSEDTYTNSPYPEVAVSSNLVLHQNNYALPLGIILDRNKKLDNWNEHSNEYGYYKNAFERENEFSGIFDAGDIYDIIEINEITDISEAIDSEKNYYFIEEEADGSAVFVFLIGTTSSGKIYIQINNAIEYVGQATEGVCDTLYLNVSRPVYNSSKSGVSFAVLNEQCFNKLYFVLSHEQLNDIKCESSTISGTINSEDGGLLYLAMPKLPGFKAYVDGTEQEIINYLSGVGLNVSAGKHNIKLVYTPEGMWIGIGITCIFFIILCIYGVICYRRIENEKVVIKKRIKELWLLIALIPFPLAFLELTHSAFSNSWFVILVGSLMVIFSKKREKEELNEKTNLLLEILLSSLFLAMLPLGDVINNDYFIVGNILFQAWKWLFYLPALLYCTWFIIHKLIMKLSYDIDQSCFIDRFDTKLGLINSKACFVIIMIVALIFLLSTYPGYYLKDDVLRVLLRVYENSPSDWDTYGYYLFVKILTFNGGFIYGVNIFQTILWLIINYYIITSFEKWSAKAMRIYTLISVISVVPMFYLEIMYKDTVFAMGMLALSAGIFNVLRKSKIDISDLLILTIPSFFATLCRKGGFVATFVGVSLITVYFIKKDRKSIIKASTVLLAHILLYFMIYTVLFNINNVKPVDPYVKYGTPLSMIGAAVSEEVEMDDEDIVMLEKVMDISEWSRCYNRYLVDSIARVWGDIDTESLIKLNDLVANDNYGRFLLGLNAKLVLKHPLVWFDAFFAMSNPIWEISTPYDFIIHSASETPLVGIEQDENIRYTFAYSITDWFVRAYAENSLLKSLFYRGGFSLFVIIFSIVIFFIIKEKKYIMVFVPLLVYLIVLFLAIPAPDARYSLPSIEIAIFTFAVMFGMINDKERV